MLPRQYRLRRTRDIFQVRRSRTRARGTLFTIHVRWGTDWPTARFGIVVGRTVSKRATARNVITRRVRAFLASRLSHVPPGTDVLIIAHGAPASFTWEQCCAELAALFTRLHIEDHGGLPGSLGGNERRTHRSP